MSYYFSVPIEDGPFGSLIWRVRFL